MIKSGVDFAKLDFSLHLEMSLLECVQLIVYGHRK